MMATVAPGSLFGGIVGATNAQAGETPSAPDAQVYFIGIEDGATISGPVTVVFGLKGMGVAPAGTEKAGTGHHHLLIDTDLPTGEDLDYSVPSDENHRHFGGGTNRDGARACAGYAYAAIAAGRSKPHSSQPACVFRQDYHYGGIGRPFCLNMKSPLFAKREGFCLDRNREELGDEF